MAPGHVDPVDWLLDWWYLQAFPRFSSLNDLARQSRHRRPLQHLARPRDRRYSGSWWYLPRALLPICLCRLHLLQ